MSEVPNHDVKSSWNGSCLYLPDSESISYFPIGNFGIEPKKETVLKKSIYHLYDIIGDSILYVPTDNHHQLSIISPLGGFNKCLQTYDEEIQDFKVGREHIVIVLETGVVAAQLLAMSNIMSCNLKEIVYMKNFSNLTPNLVTLSYDDKVPILVCPSLNSESNSVALLSLNTLKTLETFNTQTCNISNIALNYGATLVATVPQHSKTIRIYSIEGILLKQFQKSKDGEVDFLKFNSNSSYLVSAQNSNYVLIYKLSNKLDQASSSTYRKVSEEKEFAYIKMPKEVNSFRVVGFNENHVSFIGVFVQDNLMNVRLFEIDQQNGGECKQVMMFNAASKDTDMFQL